MSGRSRVKNDSRQRTISSRSRYRR